MSGPSSPARRWIGFVALTSLAISSATAGVAFAKWSGASNGRSTAKAQVVNTGNQPTATATSASVAVAWTSSVLTPGGQSATGYIVRRYDGGGVAQTIGSACTGTIAALTCTEANVPNGTWQYSVTPALGNWRGPESTRRSVTVSVPTVTSLSPSFQFRNTTQNITVTGAGFVSGAAATFSGTGITVNSTTFNSATQLTVNITVASAATTGTRNVTVTNPTGLGSGTCTNCLTIPTAPTVTSAAPSSRGQGASNQNITITGTLFQSGATVSFSGTGITVNSTTFNSATQLTANITVSGTATTGARNVVVTAPGAVSSGTCTNCFTVNAGPGTFSLSPNSRGQGATSQNVTITGSAFVNGATVAFSGTGITLNSTTFNSATQLTVNLSVDTLATTGARDVTITNPDGGTRTTTGAFTVVVKPVPTSLNPASRNRGTTGNEVITGSGFASGASVVFSGTGITVNSTTFNSATQLTVSITITSGAATGARNVTVTNSNAGTGSCTNCFTVN